MWELLLDLGKKKALQKLRAAGSSQANKSKWTLFVLVFVDGSKRSPAIEPVQ